MNRFASLWALILVSIPSLKKRALELLKRDARPDRELLSLSQFVRVRSPKVSVISTVLASSILILAGCGGSSSPSTSGGTGGSKQQVVVSIVSKPSQVLAGTNFQFEATVAGISGDQGVNWAVPTPNGGSIDTTGLYVAPTAGTFPMSVTVTATSQAASAGTTSTSFTVTQNGQHGAVTITASPSQLGAGANWQFNATVVGLPGSQGVNWTVPTPNGGTIDSTGLYIAPNSGTFPLSVSVTATSQSDPTASTTSSFTVAQTDPLGTATGMAITCPNFSGGLPNSGSSCYQIDTSCPGVADFSAYLKVNQPASTPLGTVMFGTGTGGATLYDNDPLYVDGGTNGGLTVVESVLNTGYTTVQVTFGSPFATQPSGWLTGPGGVRKLACRYATVAQWVYQNIHNSNTNAPLCATGNSGGAGAIGYALTDYGMNSIFSMVEETSGPPMSRLDQGCLPASNAECQKQQFTCNAGNPVQNLSACYTPDEAQIVDAAYSQPVCSNAVNGITPPNGLLLSDSILGGLPPTFAKTRVNVLVGGQDNSTAVEQALLWVNSLTNTSKSQACVSDAPHPIPSVADGASTIAADIQNLCKLQ
jgi:hypothetical protein